MLKQSNVPPTELKRRRARGDVVTPPLRTISRSDS
nr:MAG TPA: hypothetical protein [Caudoviricetes sp.]